MYTRQVRFHKILSCILNHIDKISYRILQNVYIYLIIVYIYVLLFVGAYWGHTEACDMNKSFNMQGNY